MSLADLREAVEDSFSLDELRTICFDMRIPYENLQSDTKEAMVRELLVYCENRGRLPKLLNILKKERPNIRWQSLYKQYDRNKPLFRSRTNDQDGNNGARPKIPSSVWVAIIGLIGTIITVTGTPLVQDWMETRNANDSSDATNIIPEIDEIPMTSTSTATFLQYPTDTSIPSTTSADTPTPAAIPTNTPTPTAILTDTPVPVSSPEILDIFFCDRPCGDVGAVRISSTSEKVDRIYASWSYRGMTPGLRYSRVWSINGNEWVRYDCIWQGAAEGTFNLPALFEVGGFRSGTWVVTFYLGGEQVAQGSILVEGNHNYWAPAGKLSCPDF